MPQKRGVGVDLLRAIVDYTWQTWEILQLQIIVRSLKKCLSRSIKLYDYSSTSEVHCSQLVPSFLSQRKECFKRAFCLCLFSCMIGKFLDMMI